MAISWTAFRARRSNARAKVRHEDGGTQPVWLTVSGFVLALVVSIGGSATVFFGFRLPGWLALPLIIVWVTGGAAVSRAALAQAMRRLGACQPLQHATGAAHAAGWFDCSGEPLVVREDVGRHNALDKLIGALVTRHADLQQGFAAVTSRASVEMVHKAARAGIGLLAAVSAPTRLAIRLAQESGLTLVGFVRETRGTAYAHRRRITA